MIGAGGLIFVMHIATPSLLLAIYLLALFYLTLLFTSTMRRLNDSNIHHSISLTYNCSFRSSSGCCIFTS